MTVGEHAGRCSASACRVIIPATGTGRKNPVEWGRSRSCNAQIFSGSTAMPKVRMSRYLASIEAGGQIEVSETTK
jgi:hypothetical protein